MAEAFWAAVRGNLARIEDARDWWRVIEGPIEPIVEDQAFLDQAAACLPPEPWDGETWGGLDARL